MKAKLTLIVMILIFSVSFSFAAEDNSNQIIEDPSTDCTNEISDYNDHVSSDVSKNVGSSDHVSYDSSKKVANSDHMSGDVSKNVGSSDNVIYSAGDVSVGTDSEIGGNFRSSESNDFVSETSKDSNSYVSGNVSSVSSDLDNDTYQNSYEEFDDVFNENIVENSGFDDCEYGLSCSDDGFINFDESFNGTDFLYNFSFEDVSNSFIGESSFDVSGVFVDVDSDSLEIVVVDDFSTLATTQTFYVNGNSGSDSNSGTQSSPFKTVEKAIDSVSSGNNGVINVGSGTYSVYEQSITGKTISFIGNSRDDTIFDFNSNIGFTLENCVITFEKLTLTNAYHSGQGGALRVKSNVDLTISNCKITNNHAKVGGVIFTSGTYNNININNSIFTNNSALTQGGALSISSPTSKYDISYSYFDNNSCNSSDVSENHLGGAIYCGNQTSTTIKYCNFTNNSAYNGTAIFNGANATINITNSNFTSNYGIHNSSTANKTAGAVFINTGKAYFASCHFANNIADYGGAIAIFSKNSTNITTSTFNENTAYTMGGAIYNNGNLTITNSKFNTNNGTIHGGAILDDGYMTVSLRNVSFVDNRVGTDSISATEFIPEGGAISITGESRGFTINNCSFIHNLAYYGGAIFIGESSMDVVINNTIFINNTAKVAGAIYTYNSNNLTCSYTIFDSNSAVKKGGAIYIGATTTLTLKMENVNFTNNFVENSDGEGGAIYVLKIKLLDLNKVIFDNNTVLGNGGAICIYYSAKYVISNSTITNNKASNGGAIYINNTVSYSKHDSSVQVKSCIVNNNTGLSQFYSVNEYDPQYNNNWINWTWFGQNNIPDDAEKNFNLTKTVLLQVENTIDLDDVRWLNDTIYLDMPENNQITIIIYNVLIDRTVKDNTIIPVNYTDSFLKPVTLNITEYGKDSYNLTLYKKTTMDVTNIKEITITLDNQKIILSR